LLWIISLFQNFLGDIISSVKIIICLNIGGDEVSQNLIIASRISAVIVAVRYTNAYEELRNENNH
jgi:hypothetical protein